MSDLESELNKVTEGEPIPDKAKEMMKMFPNPVTGKYHDIDMADAYHDEEIAINQLLSMGFEPYAVTMEPDTRPQASLKGKFMVRYRQWFRRVRLSKDQTEEGKSAI